MIIEGHAITNWKRTKEKLKESEEKYRLLFQSLPDLIVQLDREGRFLTFNPVVSERFGVPINGMVNKKLSDLAPKNVTKRRLEMIKKVLDEGKPHIFEDEREGRHFYNILVPIKISGQKDTVQLISRDISKQVMINKALHQEKAYVESIVRSLPDMLVITNIKGEITYINKALASFSGHELKKIIGKSLEQVIKGLNIFNLETVKIISNSLKECLKTGKSIIDMELELTNYRSEKIPCIFSVSGIIGKNGNILGEIVTIKDISEHKRSEEALRDEKKFSDSLIASMPYGFSVLDRQGVHINVNPALCQMTGYSREDLAAMKPPYIYWAPEDIKSIEKALERTLRGDLNDHEFTFIRKDGARFPVIISPSTIKNKQGEIISTFAAIKDITEQKKAEEKLKRSREQFRNLAAYLQTAREEERTLMAREIHDELGQALTALKMDISWLAKRIPKKNKPLLEKIKAMSNLTDATIKTVQKISTELRPGLLDDLGLNAAIEWQAEEFQKRTGIICIVVIDPEDIQVDQDLSTTIFRIFQETLTNVARHANATQVKVLLKKNDKKLTLEIQDNGIGILEKQISDPKSLGLSGIQERVKSWGGEVKIRGKKGRGTSISIIIRLDNKKERII